MPKRRLSRPGLSYWDANKHRLVHIDDDVLGVKSEIQSRWPELSVYFDDWDEKWVIVEHCKDGVDRLVFDVRALNRNVVERLEKADGNVDFADEVDKHNAEIERDRMRRFHDQLGDFAERFRHALKKDGYFDHEDYTGTGRNRARESRRSQNSGPSVRRV